MILHWLLTHLISLLAVKGVMFAATAGIIDIGGGAPLVEDTGETSENEGGENSEIDGGGTQETEGGETEETDKSAVKETEAKVDWKTVPPAVKVHLQEIAKTNPTLANMIQNAVYTSQSMLREFPGGIKEVRALKTSIEELGGIDEAKGIKGQYEQFVQEQEVIDNKAASGDASVVDDLMEVAGDGFGKLMPVALDKWASKDPDGYQHVISKVMVSAMQEGGLVADLNLAFKMLKLNNPEATKVAIESLEKVAGWVNGVGKIALKAPEKPAVDPKIAEQQRNIDTQNTQIFNEKFSNQFGAWRNNRIKEEISSVLPKGKSLTPVQMQTLGNWAVSAMKDILTADEDYVSKLDKYYGARDMSELLKFTKSRTDKLIKTSVSKGYRELFSNFGVVKKMAPQTDKTIKPDTGTTTKSGPVIEGWTKVEASKAPTPQEIDNNKTTFEMKFAQQAILKTGKKVYWGNKTPKQ